METTAINPRRGTSIGTLPKFGPEWEIHLGLKIKSLPSTNWRNIKRKGSLPKMPPNHAQLLPLNAATETSTKALNALDIDNVELVTSFGA